MEDDAITKKDRHDSDNRNFDTGQQDEYYAEDYDSEIHQVDIHYER